MKKEILNAVYREDADGEWVVELKDGITSDAQMIAFMIEGIEGYSKIALKNGDKIRIIVEREGIF